MKTRIIELTSHWNGCKLRLRISAAIAEELFKYSDPMDRINMDCDKVYYGLSPYYLSVGQILKIRRFFAKDNINYFDEVELL